MPSDLTSANTMTGPMSTSLELDDIQRGVLHQRPSPYVGTYLLLRIDNPDAGRRLVRRLIPVVEFAQSSSDLAQNASISVGFTYQGLKALGVPRDSLASFAPEFRQGMAARAAELGDVGDSGPDHWEKPLGSPEVHVALSVLSPDAAQLETLVDRARRAHEELTGVQVIWRQDCYQLPTGRTSFGFKDGIGQPAVEGSGIPGTNPDEQPIKAGEFILGYPDETGSVGPMPTPEVLGRNGTYLVFRKLHTRVAAYRQYLRAKAASREEEALLGAKMVGRWPSGAPLALCPEQDDPGLGAHPDRNNHFGYGDDLRGFKCPAGAHARRANPRDALDHEMSVNVRLHRMLRRGTSYGPTLPDGVLEDDGADRGIIFVFVGAYPKRQFEFVKTQWLNDGIFIGAPAEKDPLAGASDGTGTFTIPQRPIRRRLQSLPPFVVTRGGEYCFAPGLRALHWLAEPHTETAE
jgi:Dyp-type peroxidase family